MELAHGPPLQARVAAANRTVHTTSYDDDPGAHGMNRGQSKIEQNGANDEKGSGHGKGEQAHIARRTRPLQADTAGGLSARHRPQETTASSWPASPCSAG